MSFLWPGMLWTLALVPILIGVYVRAEARRRRLAAHYGTLGVVQQAGGRRLGRRRHLPAALFLVGLAILLVGLARPQAVVSLPRPEGTVVLAFDVSGSMAADDMKPSRMDAAKAAARDFVQHQPLSIQIAVVGFSDNGFSVQPPTDDHDAILASINRLAPQRGTSLAHGIQASLSTISARAAPGPRLYSNLPPTATPTPTPVPQGTFAPAVVVMLTDGENNEAPDPLLAAKAAADQGVRIYTVGIGSPTGTTLHINGFTVHTQLDEALLKQVAALTQGAYFHAQSAQDLLTIYDGLSPQLVVRPEKTELTGILAGAGSLVLLLGAAFSLLWFGRVA